MKLLKLLFTFFIAVGISYGQGLNIKYEIEMGSTEPEVQAQLGMLQGSTFEVFSKGEQSRTEMSMGGLMKTITIIDGSKDAGVLLLDGMMGKLGAKFDLADMEGEGDSDEELEIELVDETKKILGYKCKKAIVYTEDDIELVYWYTEEITPKAGSMGKFVKEGIPGLPLEFTVDQPQMTMKFTAVEYKKKVKGSKDMFSTEIPEGFTERSFEEMSKMTGQ